MLLSLSSVLKRSNLNIRVEGLKPLIIYSYPGLLSQLLSNLVINSNIHGFEQGETGEIIIEFAIVRETLAISYTDNGGSGLGLNIIHNIVTKRLEGTIICTSELGYRVEFRINYPASLPCSINDAS